MICFTLQTPAAQAQIIRSALEFLAHQRFIADGEAHGNDLGHWFCAEEALRRLQLTECATIQSEFVCIDLPLPECRPRLILSMSSESFLLFEEPSGVLAILRMPAEVEPTPVLTAFDGNALRMSLRLREHAVTQVDYPASAS